MYRIGDPMLPRSAMWALLIFMAFGIFMVARESGQIRQAVMPTAIARATALRATSEAAPTPAPALPPGIGVFPDGVQEAGWTPEDRTVTLPPNTFAGIEALDKRLVAGVARCLMHVVPDPQASATFVWMDCDTPILAGPQPTPTP